MVWQITGVRLDSNELFVNGVLNEVLGNRKRCREIMQNPLRFLQVRLAASVAARKFLLGLPVDAREKFYSLLLPPLCLNRFERFRSSWLTSPAKEEQCLVSCLEKCHRLVSSMPETKQCVPHWAASINLLTFAWLCFQVLRGGRSSDLQSRHLATGHRRSRRITRGEIH